MNTEPTRTNGRPRKIMQRVVLCVTGTAALTLVGLAVTSFLTPATGNAQAEGDTGSYHVRHTFKITLPRYSFDGIRGAGIEPAPRSAPARMEPLGRARARARLSPFRARPTGNWLIAEARYWWLGFAV